MPDTKQYGHVNNSTVTILTMVEATDKETAARVAQKMTASALKVELGPVKTSVICVAQDNPLSVYATECVIEITHSEDGILQGSSS